ncbi:cytochrome P450 [Xylariaceae sp. FL0594]|nr:cytochrome P450 [Xylariaceae sp. FL0594]
MESERIADVISLRNITALTICYLAAVAVYRLLFHPLARFPGPKLAAVTRYYEAYYDVFLNGQFTFKIADLHREYGPIIRISPYELHVADPAFYEKIYRQDGRWNKYAWAYDAHSAKHSTIFTTDHYLHRARRTPMNRFFSKATVSGRQALISRNVDKLWERISAFALSGKVVDLGAAISEFTRCTAAEFILDKRYDGLEQQHFTATAQHKAPPASRSIWHVTKHFPLYGPAIIKWPSYWTKKSQRGNMKSFLLHLKRTTEHTQELFQNITSKGSTGHEVSRTIVHEILDSDLPPEEKQFDRVFLEVATVTGAGIETTASVLRLVCYHVFSDRQILRRLRTELAFATATSGVPGLGELRDLEQLPFLTSVIMEGLRLSPGVATRLARIAPDRDLVYDDKWRIPAGTPVGMTVLLMHLDETLYPDPRRFDPDRWMDPGFHKKVRNTFVPFSRGTRICLGMYLAWAEMYLVLAALVQKFEFVFEGVSAEDFECVGDQFTIRTRGGPGLPAVVRKVQDS